MRQVRKIKRSTPQESNVGHYFSNPDHYLIKLERFFEVPLGKYRIVVPYLLPDGSPSMTLEACISHALQEDLAGVFYVTGYCVTLVSVSDESISMVSHEGVI